MSGTVRLTGILMACAYLQGCAVTTYTPAPDERMATVRVVGFGRPQICKDGKMYWPPAAPGVSDGVLVPAGQRLTLGAHLDSAGYQVTYFCRPFLSFVPEDGVTYIMNSALQGEGKCFVELVRESPARKTGVVIETSISGPSCSPR